MKPKILKARGAIVDNHRIITPAYVEILENGTFGRISNSNFGTSVDIDFGDELMFPGLTNGHCHLELSGHQPLSQHEFVPWIEELLEIKSKTTLSQLKKNIQYGINQLLLSGCTTIIDHISFDTPLNYFEDQRLSIIGFAEVLGSLPAIADSVLELQMARIPSSPIPIHLSAHAIHSVEPTVLMKLFLQKGSKPFSIHIHESKEEHEYFANQRGAILELKKSRHPDSIHVFSHDAQSACDWLQKNKISVGDTLLIHANEITDKDIEFLKTQTNICIVHCPGSHQYFKHSEFPFEKIKHANIPIALGTDSLASNTQLSLFHEIRLFQQQHTTIDFWQLLPMITTNALHPLHEHFTGQIKSNFRADFFTLNWNGTDDPLSLVIIANAVNSLFHKGISIPLIQQF